jgi:hypothetical protein
MLQQVGLVSCDIIGHSSEPDAAVQRERIRALNDLVRAAMARHAPGDVIWNAEGDGGHVAFAQRDWPAAALDLLLNLRCWSVKAGVPLRVTGHCGDVERVEGADGRVLLVGPGINLAGRLLQYGDQGRIVVSEAFRQALEQAGAPDLRFHGENTVAPKYFPPQKVFLLSAASRCLSSWTNPRQGDREALKEALARQPSWDAIYHARRLIQANANNGDAVAALLELEELGLTFTDRVTRRPRINPLIGFMDRPSRVEFVRASQLVERDTGDILCRLGDAGDTMFLILRGAVAVIPPAAHDEASGRYMEPVMTMGPGEVVGELAYALERPRTATLQCLNRTALLALNYKQVTPLLREARFSARAREALHRFLMGRVLKYVCDNVPYFIAPDRSGPLARLPDPWDAMVDSSTLLTCPARTEKGASAVLARDADDFKGEGLYLLVAGRVRDAAKPDRLLDSNDLPLLYADFPGEAPDTGRKYTVEEDARVLRIGWKAFAYDRAALHGVVEAVQRALAPPPPTLGPEGAAMGRDSGPEAFSAQSVLIRYPAPIALAYRRFCQTREPALRLDRLFKALEATIKYLAFLGLSDLFHLRAGPDRQGGVIPDDAVFDCLRRPTRMTLGKWVALLRGVAAALADEPHRFISELPEVCRPGGYLDAQLFDWIVATRNLAEHVEGSLALSEDEYGPLVGEVRPRLEEAFAKIGFVRHYPLGFVTQGVGSRSGAGVRRFYLHSCMGARVAASEQAYGIDTATPLVPEIPFVAAPDGSRLLYLWPLVLQRVAEHTGRHSLFLFESIVPRRTFLTKIRAAAIDVRVTWEPELSPQPAKDHSWLVEELRRRPPTLALPKDPRLAEGLLPTRRGELVNRTLGSNRLLALIAAGGFGTVYAAQAGDGERVAVKVLELALQRDRARQYPRFRQEFERLKQAGRHPGIIRCFESDIELIDGREYPWYSMELALGDLAARIHERCAEARGRLPWAVAQLRADILREFRAITEAVAHLHGLDIIHRDIKPGNVLIVEGGELRLADFGLVKMLDVLEEGEAGPRTSTGARLGTEYYMAPEQARGTEVGKPADVYALGIVLAELALGRRPEPDQRVTEGSTLKNCTQVQRLPKDLRKVLAHFTDADPARRPADARAAGESFGALG